jgi:hypothetical protein
MVEGKKSELNHISSVVKQMKTGITMMLSTSVKMVNGLEAWMRRRASERAMSILPIARGISILDSLEETRPIRGVMRTVKSCGERAEQDGTATSVLICAKPL